MAWNWSWRLFDESFSHKEHYLLFKRVQEHRRRRNPLRIPKDLFLDRLTIHTAWISCHLHFNLNKWVRKINGWTAPRNLQRVPKKGFLISFWLEKTKKNKKKEGMFWVFDIEWIVSIPLGTRNSCHCSRGSESISEASSLIERKRAARPLKRIPNDSLSW